jgi:pimeloyl-ACP methyl ester carboxylesterase
VHRFARAHGEWHRAPGYSSGVDVRSRLVDTTVPDRPMGAVLVLHGGASRAADVRVSPTQLSVLRMVPVARGIAHAGRGRLAVFRLLNSVRGWDTAHTPVDDVTWALAQVAERLGPRLPVSLVGHSLGGRAAILSVAQQQVRSVVALAPFVYPEDGTVAARGRRVLIVHGADDRVASPQRSRAAGQALARGNEVSYVSVSGGKHAMLRRHAVFGDLAAGFAVGTLTGAAPKRADAAVRQVLDGAPYLEV